MYTHDAASNTMMSMMLYSGSQPPLRDTTKTRCACMTGSTMRHTSSLVANCSSFCRFDLPSAGSVMSRLELPALADVSDEGPSTRSCTLVSSTSTFISATRIGCPSANGTSSTTVPSSTTVSSTEAGSAAAALRRGRRLPTALPPQMPERVSGGVQRHRSQEPRRGLDPVGVEDPPRRCETD